MSMPWSFIYEAHNTMVNRKHDHLIQSAKLCASNLNNANTTSCETSIDLNNIKSPAQPPFLKMYSQEAHAICKDAHDFFASQNYNVQYAFSNDDKMTCSLIFNKK